MGVRTVFLEQASATSYVSITCAVCHDPHNAANPGQLRFPMDVPNVDLNLCMKCHYRRSVPEPGNSTPHSPQGPVLLGQAGWVPPNFQYPPGSLVGSHGSDANPRLCATCHVNNYVVTDALTGNVTFRATGHSFDPIPCVDGDGIPTGSRTCDISQRSFRACAQCHLTETAARNVFQFARNTLNGLASQVLAMVALAPPSETSTTDNRTSTAEGAKFNAELVTKSPGTVAHNPFLAEALLLASIKQLDIDYGIKAPAGMAQEPVLRAPPSLTKAARR
jgi:predicted CXXCH cytochrome family protein